ncbi:MAG: LytTR family DNA-binding domain-containing protein [Sulfitobacter sp.]
MRSRQLALREWRKTMTLTAIWVVGTVLCGLAGPFGTHDLIGFWGRLGYWAIVVAVSIVSSEFLCMTDYQSRIREVGAWSVYTLTLGGFVLLMNDLFFGNWFSWGNYFYLVGIVGTVVVAVHAVMRLIDITHPSGTAAQIDPQTRFLQRLPLAKRASLIRIEAQDHYLKVVTKKGAELILMRLSEAVSELEAVPGVLVHRSHWVAFDGVQAHQRVNNRDMLLMSDGTEVPVSRGQRAAAREAGLF